MRTTLSVIKADIGSIGGHIAPSRRLLDTVETHVAMQGRDLLLDSWIDHTGDDIAILMTHGRGAGDEAIHRLAWDAFLAGTTTAREMGRSELHIHELDTDAGCLEPSERAGAEWRCRITGVYLVRVHGQSRTWAVDPEYPQVPR